MIHFINAKIAHTISKNSTVIHRNFNSFIDYRSRNKIEIDIRPFNEKKHYMHWQDFADGTLTWA